MSVWQMKEVNMNKHKKSKSTTQDEIFLILEFSDQNVSHE